MFFANNVHSRQKHAHDRNDFTRIFHGERKKKQTHKLTHTHTHTHSLKAKFKRFWLIAIFDVCNGNPL